jgi:hypothetical protein
MNDNRAVLMHDPDFDSCEEALEFRLTYEGELVGASRKDTRARHKHEIRRVFHKQLRRLWEITPALANARNTDPASGRLRFDAPKGPVFTRFAWLGDQFQRSGYNFVPLVTEDLSLLCGISILFLRPDPPGSLIKSGDIDNRLKTLFDAFRVPASQAELGGYLDPQDDEHPFCCLLEDDKLITSVSVETDRLLAVLSDPPNTNDVRLVITVSLRRAERNWANDPFS